MDWQFLLPILIGTGGLAALIFGALRFQREDASAIVTQARDVIGSMKELVEELESALDRCRKDRTRYVEENDQLRDDLQAIRREKDLS
jgi:hypothetical protein